MTFFYINDKPFSEACRRNKRIMTEAKRIWKLYGVEAASKYIQEEVDKTYSGKGRSKKLSKMSSECFHKEYEDLGISSSIWAKAMGFSTSYFRAVMCGMSKPSIIFEKRFKLAKRKLKKLLTIKK